MKKKLIILTLIWLCNHSALAKQPSMASDIQDYLTKHPDICSMYYVATPDKMLAQGASGYANCKDKHLMEGKYQVPTTEITKTMTAASIMLLHEQKKLNLNDYILKYIPADYWPNSQPPYWASEATIHHLLSHRTGIASYRYDNEYKVDFDSKTDEEAFKKTVLAYAANEALFYGVDLVYSTSATDYFILGMIVENISKQTLSDFFRENLFKPLAMNNTFLPSFEKSANHPITEDKKGLSKPFLAFGDGGVIASIEDIHKWNVALHNMKIVSKASYDQMTRPYSGVDTCCALSRGTLDMLETLGAKDVDYGYGLYIISLDSKEHLYCSCPESRWGEEMWYLAPKNISIVLSANNVKPGREIMKMIRNFRNKLFNLIYR